MGGLEWEFAISRMRQQPNNKKAGRFPIRAYEGPTKNLLLRHIKKRPARSEDTKVPLAGNFILKSKRAI